MLEIGRAVFGLGGRKRKEDNFRLFDCALQIGGEGEPFFVNILLQKFRETRFIDRALSLAEGLQFLFVNIHADDIIATFGKAGADHQADVAGTDDGESHEFPGVLVKVDSIIHKIVKRNKNVAGRV